MGLKARDAVAINIFSVVCIGILLMVIDSKPGTAVAEFFPLVVGVALVIFALVIPWIPRMVQVHRELDTGPMSISDKRIPEHVYRMRCRCGSMVLAPSPGCVWHDARAKQAVEARQEFGSVEA